MLLKITFTISLFLFSVGLFCQTNYSFNTEAGIGLNRKMGIAGSEIKSKNGVVGAFHATIQRNSAKKVLLETSLFTMFMRNDGRIDNIEFVIRKSKVGLDVVAGYNFSEKTQFLIGTAVSTISALEGINFYKPNNLKLDLVFKVNRTISDRFSMSLRVRELLNKLGDNILLEDPRASITLGLNYHLRKI